MKVHLLNDENIRPLQLKNSVDRNLIFKGYREKLDFGLNLETYEVIDNLKDRKTNYNTSYFLSDTKALSSIMELKCPHEFELNNKFTTYIKNNNQYLSASDVNSNGDVSTAFSSNFNSLSTSHFFTINLSTEDTLYITKEYNGVTYYAFASGASNTSASLYLSATEDKSSNVRTAMTMRYYNSGNIFRILPLSYINGSGSVVDSDVLTLKNNSGPIVTDLATATFSMSSHLFEVKRNKITQNTKPINTTLSFYISSYVRDEVDLNTNTSLGSVSSNYLLYSSNYTIDVQKNSGTFSANILPLKNQFTLEEYPIAANHFNHQPEYLNRQYEKIFSGNNSANGYDKIYLSYNIGTKDLHFPPSKLTYFTTPSSLSPYTKLNVNDSKIDYLGAVPGNNPLMSDKVYKRRQDIKNNSFTGEHNPTYLCTWLSGSPTGNRKWVDRYYNPDYNDFTEAMVNQDSEFADVLNAASVTNKQLIDINSKLTFEANNDYAFYHIGERDYEQFILSMETYSLSKDLEVLNYKGSAGVTTKVKNDTEINFNGETFGKFQTDKKGDFSFTFWLSAQDYTLPLGYKLLGNYFEEGFAVFNTDLVTPNIYLPTGNKLLLLNTDLTVYDEIELFEQDTPINIKAVARRDIFSEFYILGENNVIYIYNSNPNLVSKITDLSGVQNLDIEDIEVTDSKIIIATSPFTDRYRNGIFTHNLYTNETTNSTTASADVPGKRGKIYFKNNSSPVFKESDSNINTGNELAADSQGNIFTIKQKYPDSQGIIHNTIYKNNFVNLNTNTISLSGGRNNSIATNIIIDDNDLLYVLYDGDTIARLTNDRQLLNFKRLSFLQANTTKYIDLIYDFEGKEYKRYILIVEKLSTGTLLHKLDFNLNLIETKTFGGVNINSLKLTKTITGYNYLKKQNASKNRFKVVLKPKPIFTKTGALKKDNIVIDYDITKLKTGYNHFAINVSTKQGLMELYINGKLYQTRHFPAGKYALDNPLGSGIFLGALSTPYNLTLSNRLLQKGKYFLEDIKIKGFKMYSRLMDYYEIKSHINYHGLNKDCVWSIPMGQRTYTDTIDRVFKFNVPEKNTNTYDVVIKNLNAAARLEDNIKREFAKELPKITPYYDKLRDIVVDNPDTTTANVEIIYAISGQSYSLEPGDCLIRISRGKRYIQYIKERVEKTFDICEDWDVEKGNYLLDTLEELSTEFESELAFNAAQFADLETFLSKDTSYQNQHEILALKKYGPAPRCQDTVIIIRHKGVEGSPNDYYTDKVIDQQASMYYTCKCINEETEEVEDNIVRLPAYIKNLEPDAGEARINKEVTYRVKLDLSKPGYVETGETTEEWKERVCPCSIDEPDPDPENGMRSCDMPGNTAKDAFADTDYVFQIEAEDNGQGKILPETVFVYDKNTGLKDSTKTAFVQAQVDRLVTKAQEETGSIPTFDDIKNVICPIIEINEKPVPDPKENGKDTGYGYRNSVCAKVGISSDIYWWQVEDEIPWGHIHIVTGQNSGTVSGFSYENTDNQLVPIDISFNIIVTIGSKGLDQQSDGSFEPIEKELEEIVDSSAGDGGAIKQMGTICAHFEVDLPNDATSSQIYNGNVPATAQDLVGAIGETDTIFLLPNYCDYPVPADARDIPNGYIKGRSEITITEFKNAISGTLDNTTEGYNQGLGMFVITQKTPLAPECPRRTNKYRNPYDPAL